MKITPLDKHEVALDQLADRLWVKNREVYDHVPIVDRNGRTVSDADIQTLDYRNGKIYLTRYEVKTGYNGRKSARHQAREWYKLFDGIGFIVPNFVYYNPVEGECERWKP